MLEYWNKNKSCKQNYILYPNKQLYLINIYISTTITEYDVTAHLHQFIAQASYNIMYNENNFILHKFYLW